MRSSQPPYNRTTHYSNLRSFDTLLELASKELKNDPVVVGLALRRLFRRCAGRTRPSRPYLLPVRDELNQLSNMVGADLRSRICKVIKTALSLNVDEEILAADVRGYAQAVLQRVGEKTNAAVEAIQHSFGTDFDWRVFWQTNIFDYTDGPLESHLVDELNSLAPLLEVFFEYDYTLAGILSWA